MRWIPITERLPEGADAISCEAWCEAEEPGEVAGPCIMHFDAEADEVDRWTPREETGCWEPGPVTHWRSRPTSPTFVPMTEQEVRNLSAVVWGAPAGDAWIEHVGVPMVRAVEDCVLRGERPKDPAAAEKESDAIR